MPTEGLRQRKKQRTRQTLIRVAMRLFCERGFEATTIAGIAAAADIAPRTFFGYFATKEDVVFHDFDALFARFRERLDERAPEESAFDAMRAWLLELVAGQQLDGPAEARRRELIRSTPALLARERANLARFQALLEAAVARDLDVPPGSLRPHLVAAAAAAALDAVGSFHADRIVPDAERVSAIFDEALVFLTGGVEALRRHPPVP